MKINCPDCLKDNHNSCKNEETCLCAESNHGIVKESLKDGVLVRKYMDPPKDEPKEYEKAREMKLKLDEMFDEGVGKHDPQQRLTEMVKLTIQYGHVVSKIKLQDIFGKFIKRFNLDVSLELSMTICFEDDKIFGDIKNICHALGEQKHFIVFDKSQLIEASYFIMGRYHVKRIELNGNMLFFNDKYYEKEAEPLIRRKARECLLKSKNGDVNEIVKMIEDSCPLIKWKDIENSIHLKCLLNGTYDIKQGIFTESFSPDNIILNIIPHNYDTDCTWNEIDGKVSEIIVNEIDRESYYDSLSTALHPYTGIDFQFGGIGQPGTGKSQICQLSIMTLGDDNVSASPIHLIANDLTTQKDVAFMFLNIDMDMSNEAVQKIDVLKRWITQDKFTARGIYEHNSTFRPMARLCFMANDLYEIANTDDADAIYERTHIIKINQKFRGQKNQVKNLFQKIATESELSGFITYLLRNATDIFNNQRIRHPINIQTVRDTWNLHGNRIKEFSEINCDKGISYRVDQVEVWNRWLSFANKKGYAAKDKKKFHQIFDEIVGNSPSKTRIEDNQVMAYSGFRLFSDEEIAERETISVDGYGQKITDQTKPKTDLGTKWESSKSSILSLLKITEKSDNWELLNTKVVELLELCDYSRGKQE